MADTTSLTSTDVVENRRPIARVRFELLLPAFMLLVGCMYAIFFCSSTRDVSGHAVGSDDAFISYRYARNWVEGHGLVFNVGERVEGYTNPLYVVLMAIPFLLHWDVYKFSMALNTICALGTLAIFWSYVRRHFGERGALLAGVLLALSPSLWIWVSSGLETPVVVLLQVAIWVLLETLDDRPSGKALGLLCLSIALLVLVRADGFVTGLLATAYLGVKGHRRLAVTTGAVVACTLGALFAWRLAYYHELWPNTYYAKVSSTLLRRVVSASKELVGVAARQGLVVWLFLAVLTAAGAVRALLRGADERAQLRFHHVFPVIWVAYWLYVGGDVFEDRFLVILIPLGIFQLFELLGETASANVRNVLVGLALLVPLSVVARENQFGKTLAPKYDRWITLGHFLGEQRPGRLLATSAAGKIPFFSGLETIDVLGLTDRFIGHLKRQDFAVGHSKYDPDYVLSRKPDLVTGWVYDNLDIDSGMTTEKYRAAGYSIRFLVSARQASLGASDILDVRGCRDEALVGWANRGWNFAVLERDPMPAALLQECPGVPVASAPAD